MAKDYERRKPPRQKSSFQPFLVGFIAFVFGYLAAVAFDAESLSQWFNKQLAKQSGPKLKIAAKKEQQPKPKFEFYTLLTKEGQKATLAAVPPKAEPPIAPKAPATPASLLAATKEEPSAKVVEAVPVATAKSLPVDQESTNRESKEKYLIQIASFKNKPDAEKLKASLTLKGFDVHLALAKQGLLTWYRVIVGPFPSRIAAEKMRAILAKNERLQGMVRRA